VPWDNTGEMSIRSGLVSAAAYLAVLLLHLGPSVFPDNALAGGDWTFLIYPFHRFSLDIFHAEGRLPFWNNLILGGNPHLASMNVLTLYPTELLTLPFRLPSSTFYALDLILHFLVAGLGFNWWLAGRGMAAGAAFTGGLFYMLGGHALSLAGAGHPHTVRCLAWLPFLLAFLERGEKDGRPRWFVLSGLALGMCVLTAAMQFVAYAVPVAACWILADRGADVRGKAARFSLVAVTLAGIGAIVWLPGLEYWGNSARFAPRPGLAGEWALSPWELATFLVPGLFGDARVYFGPHLFRDSTDYAGLVPLALAAAGALSVWRANLRFLVLAAAALVLAMGPATPVGALLAGLPVYGGFRNPLRWMTFFHLAVSFFAANGFEALRRASGRKRTRVLAAVVMALSLPCLLLAVRSGEAAGLLGRAPFVRKHLAEGRVGMDGVDSVLRSAGFRGAAAAAASSISLWFLPASGPFFPAAVWTVTVLDLASASGGYFQHVPLFQQEGPDAVSEWLEVRKARERLPFRAATDEYFAQPNRRMPSGVEWASGYHGLPLGRYAAFFEEARNFRDMALLSLLNVRFVVSTTTMEDGWTPAARLDLGNGRTARVMENPAAYPRAFLGRELVPCPDMEAVLAGLRAPGWNPGKVLTDTAVPPASARVRLSTRGSISSPLYGREAIEAQVGLDGPGLLVFSENWYPAWKAWIDGTRVRIIRAYGVLRALAVPVGEHDVRMIYDSWLFKIGMWVSILAAVTLATLAVAAGRLDA